MSSTIWKLLDGETGTVTGDQVPTSSEYFRDNKTAFLQVDLDGGTGSVMVQGRIDPALPWVNILDAAITADSIQVIAALPYMRATLTSGSASDVNVWVRDR